MLAVAILGGASLVGGVGSVGGVVLAVLFLAMLQNGLNLVGVSSYFFGVVIGLAILISVSMTAYARISRAQTVRRETRRDARPASPSRRVQWSKSPARPTDRNSSSASDSISPVSLRCLLCSLRSFSFFMPATFPRVTTLQAMMFQLPELGLLSLAMAIPLISGGINLAIIATANQASLLMAWILTAVMPAHASGATLALWLFARARRRTLELHHRWSGHRIDGGRHRHPSDPGDARNHDLASWPQHLFHPRPDFVRLPRRA